MPGKKTVFTLLVFFCAIFAVIVYLKNNTCSISQINRRNIINNLYKSLDKGDFESAAMFNSFLAKEAFQRAYNTLKAWESVRDPQTSLLPKALYENMSFWNSKDTAADLFPFLFLAANYLDKDNEYLWLLTLKQERELCGVLPRSIVFNPARVQEEKMPEIIFGAAEYAKDGLLSIAERLGPGPWLDRLEELADEIISTSCVQTPLGNIPSDNTETNGNMLQVLTRLYWMTKKQEYLQMAERIGEVYFFEIFPKAGYIPPHKWNFKKQKSVSSYFRLLDHGSEIVSGLTELYVLEKLNGYPNAARYREPVKKFLDELFKLGYAQNGLWDEAINIKERKSTKTRVADTWGYIMIAYQMFDLAENAPTYEADIEKVMVSVSKLKSFPWQWGHCDGYADTIESMLYLLPWFDIRSCNLWVDTEAGVMFNMQKPSGFIGEDYLDGNFIRTALLYATYKTMGVVAQPWRKDLLLGSAYDKVKKELYVYLNADAPWKGSLKFDAPRHRIIFNLPMEFPRLNESPEWFIAQPQKKYFVVDMRNNKTSVCTGDMLIKGLFFNLDKKHAPVILKISAENLN